MRLVPVLFTTAACLLACGGGPLLGGSSPDRPTFPAEPVALVDLPGDEFPTGLALLADGAFAASFRTIERDPGGMLTTFGGVRFRARDGGPGPHADLEPELNVSADTVALSPDGTRLAVVRYDRIDLVPLDGGAVVSHPLYDPLDTSGAGLLAKCSAAGQILWTGSTIAARCAVGPRVVLLDVETGARTLPVAKADPDGADVTVYDLALSADGRTLAVLGASDDYSAPARRWVELRSLPDGALLRRLPLAQTYDDVALSPDAARLALSHPYFGLQLLDAADGHVLAEHTYPEDRGNRGSGDVLWSPEGLYRVGERLGISVHDPADAHVLGYFPAHPTEPENPMPPPADWPATLSARNGTLARSADGRFLASIERTDFGRAVRIWRLTGP